MDRAPVDQTARTGTLSGMRMKPDLTKEIDETNGMILNIIAALARTSAPAGAARSAFQLARSICWSRTNQPRMAPRVTATTRVTRR